VVVADEAASAQQFFPSLYLKSGPLVVRRAARLFCHEVFSRALLAAFQQKYSRMLSTGCAVPMPD
jgi:hypothetical protein